MDLKVKKGIQKVIKVIKMFEENVTIYPENKELELDDKGNPIKSNKEIKVKMAVMTPKSKYFLNDSINGSFLSDTKEAYYILKDDDEFKITENMLLKHKETIYRVVKIEENYGVFLRMEININDKRN